MLKEGGVFLLCSEASRPKGNEKRMKMPDMPVYTEDELSDILRQAVSMKFPALSTPAENGFA